MSDSIETPSNATPGGGADGSGASPGSPETGPQDDQNVGPKSTETVEFWKGKARDQENRAKANAKAATELVELQGKYATAEAEVAGIPAKVAEALKGHLVARHGIDADAADLFLTATEPELLLKQIDRLLSQSDKRKRKNYVPDEGNNNRNAGGGDGLDKQFVRNLFGNNN